jgi:hypothetical protein
MHTDGTKLVVVYNLNGEFEDVSLGNAFVEDEDDWDLPDKTFTFVSTQEWFQVNADTGELFMRRGAPPQTHEVVCDVVDTSRDDQSARAYVYVEVNYIDEEVTGSAGSIVLSGKFSGKLVF